MTYTAQIVVRPITETRKARFGPFEVDLDLRMLRKHGVRVKLQTQPFQILAALLEEPGRIVTRAELRQRLWPDATFVDFEHGLNAAVARLRQALGDSIKQPRYIETLAKLGYRFSTRVEGESDDSVLIDGGHGERSRNSAAPTHQAFGEPAGHLFRSGFRDERGHARAITVGRSKELAELEATFRAISDGSGAVLSLAGEAGIGKSTLLQDFAARLRRDGAACYTATGRCSERFAGTEAYLPLLEALESLLCEAGDRVVRLLKLVAPTWYIQVAPLCIHDSPDSGMLADVKAASQERLKRELVTFFAEVSRLHPLVLFFDDIHWADASTVDLLGYVGNRIAEMRVLVVATYRPSDLLLTRHPFLQVKQELQAHGLCREIEVGFLSIGDIEQYLALEFPDHAFPADLASSIHARTEGNALFTVDLLRYLRDRGVIARSDEQWTLAQPLPEIRRDLPESIRSMIQRKLDQLDEPARRLAVAAAVQGAEFDSAVIAKALALECGEVEERLETMDRLHGLVRLVEERELPDGTLTLRYSFVHVLYQNVLATSLAGTRKASLSRAIGGALTRFYQEAIADVASELALLFHDARDFATASDQFLQAARNAARVYAYPEAIALCHRALADAAKLRGPEHTGRTLATAVELGALYRDTARFEDAIRAFDLAERTACNGADVEAQINAICSKATVLFFCQKRPTEAREEGERALELAQRAGSNMGIAASEFILACTRWCSGQIREAEILFNRAIPALRRSGPPLLTVTAVSFRGSVHAMLSEYDDAEHALDWADLRAHELGASYDRLRSLFHKSRVLGNRGRISNARDVLDEAIRLSDRIGDTRWRSRLSNTHAWLLCEAQDLEAALRLDTEAAEVAAGFADLEGECNSHINAARDYLALEEPARALHHLRRAEELHSADFWFRWVYNPRLQGELAQYWIAQGNLKQAAVHAAVSLEGKNPKRRAWGHKLQGDIAALDDRVDEAGREYEAALRLIGQVPCPTIEWRVLKAWAELAAQRKLTGLHQSLRTRAQTVVQSLALSIREESLRNTLLSSKAVRDL